MSVSLYEISFISAIALMLFISIILIFGPVPYKHKLENRNYILSRRCMGIAIFLLATSYCLSLAFNLDESRMTHCMLFTKLFSYMTAVPFIYSALRLLMERDYISAYKRDIIRQLVICLIYTALLIIAARFLFKDNLKVLAVADAAIYFTYCSCTCVVLYRRYRKLLKNADDTQTDDIKQYVRWMSLVMFALILWGPACAICVFIPDKYVFIWVFLSIFMYVYVFFAYKNYLLFSDMVIHISPLQADKDDLLPDDNVLSDYYRQRDEYTAKLIQKWIDEHGFTEQRLTLEHLAALLGTNRTYLSGYLHRYQVKPFREWINDLRIEYAKQIMIESPLITMAEVAERSGYTTLSHFTTTFSRNMGIPPSRWVKLNCGQSRHS